MTTYADFLAAKRISDPSTGLVDPGPMPSWMSPHQRDITRWALRRGRAAIFAGTGLGKTAMELVWAETVARHTGRPVLFFAPLGVTAQHVAEADKWGIDGVSVVRSSADMIEIAGVTNYAKMDRFDMSRFGGVILDESSILKAHDGKTRARLIEACSRIPFRLCATATPAPNDFMELGNHAEFLGVMSYSEMLAMFFVHDGGETQKWRLKGHAQDEFWRWMASWSVMLRQPSDLGYPNDGYDLLPLTTKQHIVDVDYVPSLDTGTLFPIAARTMRERIGARKSSVADRVEMACKITLDHFSEHGPEPWIIWCGLNDEQERMKKVFGSLAISITGSQKDDDKESLMRAWLRGVAPVLLSKSSIFGYGMNLQMCCKMTFVGLNDSFEQVYQSLRRCWRFGQTRPVTAHFIASELEGAVVSNLRRKEADAEHMAEQMVRHMADISSAELRGQVRDKTGYVARQVPLPSFMGAA